MTIAFLVLTLAIMLVLAPALAWLLRRRHAAPWWLFFVGAASFAGAQAVHLPLNRWLAEVGLLPALAGASGATLWRAALTLGLTAALSETAARVVTFLWLWRRDRAPDRAGATMIGLGHGGIEAMGLVGILTAAGATSLLALRGVDLAGLELPAAQLALLTRQLDLLETRPWLLLLAAGERAMAVGLHVGLSLLVWRAFARRRPVLVGVALVYHLLVDMLAAWLSQNPAGEARSLLLLVLAAGPLFVWVWRVRPRGPVRALPADGRRELARFAAALGKELWQAWRTRHALVIVAVFLLFGFGSPLLARYTPEIVGSLEGAEQFADLIPTPTNRDALDQYIRNLTQFGFIIAVVVGMGAVVGEREKGITPMILTRPLPRWAFILSKFAAQAALYAGALLLAALGAYYYTAILFEPWALGPFLWGNVLLWIWLLVFASLTLLASTLAGSTGAAAGIGLGGAAVLLLAGSLPGVGPLLPGGLVAWAAQLGLAEPAAVNGGALMTAVVLIFLFVLGAVAAFEVQEL